MRIFPEPEVLLQQFEKRPELFTFYTSCANFSSLAFIVASESWCVKNNNKNNKNNSKEGTAESVKGQRAVAPLTLINQLYLCNLPVIPMQFTSYTYMQFTSYTTSYAYAIYQLQ